MKPKFKVETEVDHHYDGEYERDYLTLENVIPTSVSLECPHCKVYSVMQLDTYFLRRKWLFDLICGCPHCEKSVFVQAKYGEIVPAQSIISPDEETGTFFIEAVPPAAEIIAIYPNNYQIDIPPEVPQKYEHDYREAALISNLSPKASAALSRRVLQNILREEYKIRHQSLAKEIDEFIALQGVPSYLSKAVDAIRNIGNIAAHPLKNTSTGEIVEVEPDEAEWLLEVLDTLFDFTFVQPKRLDKRRKELDEKLTSLGKHPMKG